MFDPRNRRRTRRRRQKIEHKKVQIQFNWFLGFLVLLLWGALFFILMYIEPELVRDIPFANWYGPFFLVFFLTLLATIRLVTGSRSRALLMSLVLTSFLILRLNGFGQWYNALLLLALGGCIDYFWIDKGKVWQRLRSHYAKPSDSQTKETPNLSEKD